MPRRLKRPNALEDGILPGPEVRAHWDILKDAWCVCFYRDGAVIWRGHVLNSHYTVAEAVRVALEDMMYGELGAPTDTEMRTCTSVT